MKRYMTFSELYAKYDVELFKCNGLFVIKDKDTYEYIGYIDPDLVGRPFDPADTSIMGEVFAKFTVEEN